MKNIFLCLIFILPLHSLIGMDLAEIEAQTKYKLTLPWMNKQDQVLEEIKKAEEAGLKMLKMTAVGVSALFNLETNCVILSNKHSQIVLPRHYFVNSLIEYSEPEQAPENPTEKPNYCPIS